VVAIHLKINKTGKPFETCRGKSEKSAEGRIYAEGGGKVTGGRRSAWGILFNINGARGGVGGVYGGGGSKTGPQRKETGRKTQSKRYEHERLLKDKIHLTYCNWLE